jgi:hypothetical protein
MRIARYCNKVLGIWFFEGSDDAFLNGDLITEGVTQRTGINDMSFYSFTTVCAGSRNIIDLAYDDSHSPEELVELWNSSFPEEPLSLSDLISGYPTLSPNDWIARFPEVAERVAQSPNTAIETTTATTAIGENTSTTVVSGGDLSASLLELFDIVANLAQNVARIEEFKYAILELDFVTEVWFFRNQDELNSSPFRTQGDRNASLNDELQIFTGEIEHGITAGIIFYDNTSWLEFIVGM